MPGTGWTPSIGPNGDDQNVYIVLDDLAATAAPIGKRMSGGPILKRSSWSCSKGNTKTPSALSASTPPTSPKNCGAVAICRCATCHQTFRILSIGTTGWTVNYLYGWHNHGSSKRKHIGSNKLAPSRRANPIYL
jgi:hypothetical protein